MSNHFYDLLLWIFWVNIFAINFFFWKLNGVWVWLFFTFPLNLYLTINNTLPNTRYVSTGTTGKNGGYDTMSYSPSIPEDALGVQNGHGGEYNYIEKEPLHLLCKLSFHKWEYTQTSESWKRICKRCGKKQFAHFAYGRLDYTVWIK